MNDEDGYFGEDVAATYDDGFEGQFDPAVIDVTSESGRHVSVWEKP